VELVDSIDVGKMVHSFVGKLGCIQLALVVVASSSFVELPSFLVVDNMKLDNRLDTILVDIVVGKLVQLLAIGRFVVAKLGL